MATGGKKEISSNLLSIGTLTVKPDDLDPWGVVVIGEKLVITDWNSRKVRVYRRHDGMLMSSSDVLESDPYGLCRVNDTDLCVVMYDGITLMSVQDSGLISRGKTFHLRPSFGWCYGVAAFRDSVVVSGGKDNTICWCVVSLQDGRHDNLHKVCGGRLSCLTTKENMAYISCLANSIDDRGVYGFNLLNPSQPPYIYKPKGMSYPYGITVDDNGDLFVCDVYSHSIHHLTEKCQLVAIYTEGIPLSPLAIFWDSGILYVASDESNVITLYRTPHQGPAISAKVKTSVDRENQKEKREPVNEGKRATEQPKVSQKGETSQVKQKAKISPLKPVIKVDPVEKVTDTLSKTGIDQPVLNRLSKDLVVPDWKFFFRELSVPEAEIEQVRLEYGRDTVREQIYQLLYRLKQRGRLSRTNVIAALRNLDREDLVAKYSKEKFS